MPSAVHPNNPCLQLYTQTVHAFNCYINRVQCSNCTPKKLMPSNVNQEFMQYIIHLRYSGLKLYTPMSSLWRMFVSIGSLLSWLTSCVHFCVLLWCSEVVPTDDQSCSPCSAPHGGGYSSNYCIGLKLINLLGDTDQQCIQIATRSKIYIFIMMNSSKKQVLLHDQFLMKSLSGHLRIKDYVSLVVCIVSSFWFWK